jgi:hypothetical protein
MWKLIREFLSVLVGQYDSWTPYLASKPVPLMGTSKQADGWVMSRRGPNGALVFREMTEIEYRTHQQDLAW